MICYRQFQVENPMVIDNYLSEDEVVLADFLLFGEN